MNMKLLAGVCAAAACALGAGQAMADPSGTLGVDYNYTTAPGASGHIDDWGVSGNIAAPITSNLTVQGDAAYDGFNETGGSNFHTDYISGTGFWQGAKARIGLTAGYNQLGASGFSFNYENYGAFGELYATNQLTFGIKGGGLTASGLHATYFGGEIVGYAMPNLALTGTYDYLGVSGGHINAYGANVEYLLSSTTPISITGGYTYTDAGSGFHLNTWMIGAKFYFGGKGTTLVDHQRSGAESWGNKATGLAFLF
jgi:hypothetical protein